MLRGQRQIVPTNYRTLTLDVDMMKSLLDQAPMEVLSSVQTDAVTVELPMPNGTMQHFRVVEYSMMEAPLAAQFPEIKTYNGMGVEDPAAQVRLDFTQFGFHAMVLSPNGAVFIDPYSQQTTTKYISYYKRNFSKNEADRMVCNVGDEMHLELNGHESLAEVGDCGTLHKYRLALACSGEYASFHGGTVAGALAAMTTTMNRVNGVFEIDGSIRMILIANNNLVVYTNAGTDPFSNPLDDGITIDENQTNMDAVILNANYDIGHVFTNSGSGLAATPSVCSTGNKARATTGSSSPVGDPFDIDYVAHEMGHQFSGKHTQYNDLCNRNDATSVEPGSGTTIMGYAGVCSPSVANHSDPYFSAASVAQIRTYVSSGFGNSCDATDVVVNTAPTVSPLSNYSIPISTPFILTASASDPGNSLTYCWEQMDIWVTSTQTMPPAATNVSGPVFRSFNPTSSPSRYFPVLSAVLSNTTPTWEVLPSVGRTLNFRVTVRDNVPGGGCTGEANNTVTTVAAAGPFIVTSPNTAVTYAGNSTQTVTWNVANTTAAPVSCANVDILISTDGGTTTSVLLANTPNDGTESVTIPNVPTTTARIFVRCSNNIFYDVSNVNFTITASACPTLTSAPGVATIVNSTCAVFGGTPSGGSISAPAGSCPSGSVLQYSTDNGLNWSTSAPTYNQSGPAQTVLTRCNCTIDNTMSSPTSTVTTAPGVCPSCPVLSTAPGAATVVNSTCTQVGGTPSGGSIAAPAGSCPAGSTLQYSTDNGGTWGTTLPVYDQDGPAQTILTRCNCNANTATSSPTSSVLTAPGVCPGSSSDLCDNAVPISCGQTVSGTTIGATNDDTGIFTACGVVQTTNGVWYTFTGNGGQVTLSTCSAASFDTKISVYSGTCASPTCVAGNDDGCGTLSTVTFTSVNGTVYLVMVHGFAGAEGNFDLTLTCACPVFSGAPANVSITNSTCAAGCTVSGGVITAPTGSPCPVGSTLEYSVNGGAFSSTLPVYAQTGPAQSITTRCSCDVSPAAVSATSTAVVTAPGVCTPPTAFAVTGGGAYCAGGTGVAIGLSGSQTGVTYQLKLGVTNVGAAVPGTGAALNFGNQTTAGTYTVVATNTTTTCTLTMTGSAVVSINQLPIAGITVTETSGAANNDNTICAGDAALLTATGGGTYLWSVPGNIMTTQIAVLPPSTTTFTVTVTGANTCMATASTTITVNSLPTAFNVTGGGTVCTTDNIGVVIGLSGSQTGVNYQLKLGAANVGAAVAGTGNAISFPGQLTVGTYTVVATNATTSCSATMSGNAVINAITCAPSI
ncbi:MAG: hypothetical protein JNM22_20900, partial [Saprospiraceae bacterium]|nr:hypothetical protein [Saprospiraceae bacterium]